jgi:hypothetical protein
VKEKRHHGCTIGRPTAILNSPASKAPCTNSRERRAHWFTVREWIAVDHPEGNPRQAEGSVRAQRQRTTIRPTPPHTHQIRARRIRRPRHRHQTAPRERDKKNDDTDNSRERTRRARIPVCTRPAPEGCLPHGRFQPALCTTASRTMSTAITRQPPTNIFALSSSAGHPLQPAAQPRDG